MIKLFPIGSLAQRCRRSSPRSLRLATFNIEEFPKDAIQIEGAFRLIDDLDVDAIAVQEITAPDVFATAARERLGPRWQFASADVTPLFAPTHISMGVLFDAERFTLAAVRVHPETRLDGRGKSTVEIVLAHAGEPPLRLFVVHFKSDATWRGFRARQFAALENVLDVARRAPGRIVVLGDFNATDDADRDALASLAAAAHLAWSTKDLPCSAFLATRGRLSDVAPRSHTHMGATARGSRRWRVRRELHHKRQLPRLPRSDFGPLPCRRRTAIGKPSRYAPVERHRRSWRATVERSIPRIRAARARFP